MRYASWAGAERVVVSAPGAAGAGLAEASAGTARAVAVGGDATAAGMAAMRVVREDGGAPGVTAATGAGAAPAGAATAGDDEVGTGYGRDPPGALGATTDGAPAA